jgi:hypothetical protein
VTTVPALLAPGQRRGCASHHRGQERSRLGSGRRWRCLRPFVWNECNDGRTRQMQHAGSCLLQDGHTDDCENGFISTQDKIE